LLDAKKVPAWGAEVAHKLLDPARPSNELIERALPGER
jgi:hypothetical protein